MKKSELIVNRNEQICEKFLERHEKEGLRLNMVITELAKEYGLMPDYIWKIVSGKVDKKFKVKDKPDRLKDV